jgi:hypothetical protein
MKVLVRFFVQIRSEQLTNGFLDMPVDWALDMSKHMRLKDLPGFLRTTDPNDTLLSTDLPVIRGGALGGCGR